MQLLPKIAIMREIQSGGLEMEIPVTIGLLAIISEVLTFMLMKEFFLPYVGQCVCGFLERLGKRYGK